MNYLRNIFIIIIKVIIYLFIIRLCIKYTCIVLSDGKYVYPVVDDVTCQLSRNSPCSRNWSRIGNWSYVTSTTKPMSPLYDNRWEGKFEFNQIHIHND